MVCTTSSYSRLTLTKDACRVTIITFCPSIVSFLYILVLGICMRHRCLTYKIHCLMLLVVVLWWVSEWVINIYSMIPGCRPHEPIYYRRLGNFPQLMRIIGEVIMSFTIISYFGVSILTI